MDTAADMAERRPRHQLILTEAGQRLAGAIGVALDLMAAALPGAAQDQPPPLMERP